MHVPSIHMYRKGHLDVVKLLITYGQCDVNRRGEYGNTPLHDACRSVSLTSVLVLQYPLFR